MSSERCANTDPVESIERLEEIARLDLLSPEVTELLQEVVDQAAKDLNLPTSMVSLVLDDAQFWIAGTGLKPWMQEAQGTPVEWAYCANSVRTGDKFVVEDSATNDLVKDNPLTELGSIRCYAGMPLKTKNGEIVGNLCVSGTESHTFSESDLARLRELADEAMDLLEKRAAAKL